MITISSADKLDANAGHAARNRDQSPFQQTHTGDKVRTGAIAQRTRRLDGALIRHTECTERLASGFSILISTQAERSEAGARQRINLIGGDSADSAQWPTIPSATQQHRMRVSTAVADAWKIDRYQSR